jgi:glycine cleavage system aminomethyltransferase T
MGRLVDLDTPDDFIGKAALTRIRDEGVRRSLVGIELPGDELTDPFLERWPVSAGGRPIGEATVALHSPRLEKNIGYAMVGIEHAHPGTAIEVHTPSRERPAMVAELPFIRRPR